MAATFLVRFLVATVLGIGLIGASVAQQVVRVASTPTGIPFTFLDTKTNQISGIMVDLIKEIGKDQGFTPEISPMTFSTLIASLQANKIDLIAAAMYITPPGSKWSISATRSTPTATACSWRPRTRRTTRATTT